MQTDAGLKQPLRGSYSLYLYLYPHGKAGVARPFAIRARPHGDFCLHIRANGLMDERPRERCATLARGFLETPTLCFGFVGVKPGGSLGLCVCFFFLSPWTHHHQPFSILLYFIMCVHPVCEPNFSTLGYVLPSVSNGVTIHGYQRGISGQDKYQTWGG